MSTKLFARGESASAERTRRTRTIWIGKQTTVDAITVQIENHTPDVVPLRKDPDPSQHRLIVVVRVAL
ncbi:MAG: hypothetical protein GXP29_13205, partial [Planctomycetes bacterium]|nr:hypothetical protein [Planctomycetota bacterium]